MPTVHLHLSADPRRLLERAAEEFLRTPPLDAGNAFASPEHVLVLRQGGLRDDLVALAAERGVPGWFDPPLWVFAEVAERLGGLEDPGVGDYARVVLVERALREASEAAGSASGGVFARLDRPEAYVDAVDWLIGELVSEGVTPDAFDAAIAQAPGEDAFERSRDADIAAVVRRYRALLDEAGATDGRDRLLRTAAAITASPDAFARRLGGRREVRIVGLLDLKAGWLTLLRALAASPALDRVRIYTSVDLLLPADLSPSVEPLDVEVRRAGPTPAVELQFSLDLDSSSEEPSHGHASAARQVARRAFAAPDMGREAEEVAVRVRRLIEHGVTPGRIAVVARQARPAIDRVCSALERTGVPVTARRRTAFAEIPVVRGVLTLFAAAADGWTRHALVEVAEQPYLGLRLDATVLNHIGYRRRVSGLAAWRAALAGLLAEARAAELSDEAEDEQGAWRERLPRAERVERALGVFAEFEAHARALDTERTLSEWLDWFGSFLAEDPWKIGRAIWRGLGVPERVIRLDLKGWREMAEIVGAWRAAAGRWGGGGDRLDAAVFERRLRGMLSGDVALWTESRRGVQVLEALAAAQRSFEHVFLVALDTERVPVRAPRSPILGDADRERLVAAGVPFELRATWDARERALLAALESCATSSLTASYARTDAGGAEVAASSFYEDLIEKHALEEERIPLSRVLTPGVPVAANDSALASAAHGARIEAIRRADGVSPWNGLMTAPAVRAAVAARLDESFVWSPTQLEAYAKCPWSWFSARLLRLAKLEDPELSLDPRTRGSVFHDALRRFYDGARERAGGPVFLQPSDLDWLAAAVTTALDAAIAAAGDDAWLGHEALRDTITGELRRELVAFVESEVTEFNGKLFNNKSPRSKHVRTAVDAHELSFDGVVLEHGGVTFRLRGTIDRVEVSVDDRANASHLIAAVDYKTSTWSTPGGGKSAAWLDGVVLQVPLYAWVLTLLREGTEVSHTEYRSIRQKAIVHPLQLHQIDRKSMRLVRSEEAVEKYEAARDAIAGVVKDARAGRFPAAPAPSCKCPDFCHAREICRVKDGPKSMFD